MGEKIGPDVVPSTNLTRGMRALGSGLTFSMFSGTVRGRARKRMGREGRRAVGQSLANCINDFLGGPCALVQLETQI